MQAEITNSGFKRKRQSDDETVEESNEKRFKYVTYHKEHNNVQGVPKLFIKQIKSHGQ